MSPQPPVRRLERRVAGLLLGLYPHAWRKRYGTEVLGLIEDDPPGARELGSLLLGAADAHIRPGRQWSAAGSPLTRMRLSVVALFCCWIAISLNGIGFQKDTEDPEFIHAASKHPLLTISHDVVFTAALLGAAAVAVGGLPLLWRALMQALRDRDRRLLALLLAPALAVAGFGLFTWLLVLLAPIHHGFTTSFVAFIQIPWRLSGWACAGVCALAPRFVLARARPRPQDLRRASWAGVALTLAMLLIAAGLIAYACALALQAGPLAAQSTAPLGASTGAMLAIYAAVATLIGAVALVAAKRARRAALIA